MLLLRRVLSLGMTPSVVVRDGIERKNKTHVDRRIFFLVEGPAASMARSSPDEIVTSPSSSAPPSVVAELEGPASAADAGRAFFFGEMRLIPGSLAFLFNIGILPSAKSRSAS